MNLPKIQGTNLQFLPPLNRKTSLDLHLSDEQGVWVFPGIGHQLGKGLCLMHRDV